MIAVRGGHSTWVAAVAAVFTGALLLIIIRQHFRLSGLAHTDPLTGLANHRGFHEQLSIELARARRDRSALALVVLDLDSFKEVNDRHGHPYGDQILQAVGAALAGAIRRDDFAARTGGEEFGLILPRTDSETAVTVAERARAAVAKIKPKGMRLSCSAGVAGYPADASEAARLVELADGALYWAKRTGKRRTRSFDPLHVRSGNSSQTQAEITAVLDEDSIVPVFQPVVALATGRIAGYEALSRFPGSPRPPESWFSEAHVIGLGPQLEAAAVRAALRPLGRPPGTHLSLNFSPSGLLSEEVHTALPDDLHDLVVEITEHEEMADRPDLLEELEGLRRRGAKIAIDDAGAGYSGLKAVTEVRPDIVKLDRGLIAGIDRDPARLALVESFVRFAARVDGMVCAEGIQTTDELVALADLDVGWGQGYALGAPGEPWPTANRFASELCRSALLEALQSSPRASWRRIATGDRLLEDLAARLAGASSLSDLHSVLGLIAAALNADVITVSRWHPQHGVVETLAENSPDPSPERFPLEQYPLTARVLRERLATQVLVGDPAADPSEVELILRLGFRSMLLVPVVEGGQSRGIIEAFTKEERAWTRTEINRARIIAHQFAPVIESFEGVSAPPGLSAAPDRPS